MEHENVDENARYLKACENVKKIVNAIKTIKMKYYTNFAKISTEDRDIYNQLETNLEKISQENNLTRLKDALMEEVSAKYDKKDIKNEQGNPRDPNSVDNRLLACYGNIDVQQKALAAGKIGKARKCQKILQQYLEEIDSSSYRELVMTYKREKFAELAMERATVERKNEEYMSYMKQCFKKGNAEKRRNATIKIEEARDNSVTLFNNQRREVETNNSELESQIG